VLNKHVITTGLAMLCAVAVAGAQTPPLATGEQQDRPGTRMEREPHPSAKAPTATIAGCVYREDDVPGRTPNVAERAGVLEDYILAVVDQPEAATGSPGSTPGATGTSGTPSGLTRTGAMYKLEHESDEELRALVGKRVEVTGKIDAEADDTSDRPAGTTGAAPGRDTGLGPDRIELAEFEVSSIREVAGTCPPKPTAR
jgi:hypothetical protein